MKLTALLLQFVQVLGKVMNIAILSRKKGLYSTRRLRDEAKKLKAKTLIIDTLKCTLSIKDNKPMVFFAGKPLTDIDVVIPRIGLYAISYTIAVIRQFRLMKIPCINSDEAIARTRNKFRCLQHLIQKGVRVPETIISRYPYYFDKLLDIVGGPPVILKLTSGAQGTGVILSETASSAQSALEAVWSLGEDIMMQKFISESKGRDIRALVINNQVVAAMRRITRRKDEFRANIHRGAIGESIKLSPQYEKAALTSASVTELGVCGVDMLESKSGPLVIEVNSSPGFQGLEKATGLNIAKMIINYSITCAKNGKR